MELIISLISGAVGGNVAGGLLKNMNLGMIGNSIAGIVGGGLGGQILGMLGAGGVAEGGTDIAGILGSVASGGVGGVDVAGQPAAKISSASAARCTVRFISIPSPACARVDGPHGRRVNSWSVMFPEAGTRAQTAAHEATLSERRTYVRGYRGGGGRRGAGTAPFPAAAGLCGAGGGW